jgi:ABC-type transporter MlaC component
MAAGRYGLLLCLVVLLAAPARAQYSPFEYRPLPSSLDLMEAGLYWLQDMTRPAQASDPATLVGAAQEMAARQFDFAEMAWYTAGWRYLRLDILERSHFQNRLRDRLFQELARTMGLYDPLPPDMRVLTPVRSGIDRITITLVIMPRLRPTHRLDFHLRYTSQGWRIVDVSDNGQTFSSFLRQQGFY